MSSRLREGLAKARAGLGQGLRRILALGRPADQEVWEELVEVLVAGDAGVEVAEAVVGEVRARVGRRGVRDAGGIRDVLVEVLVEHLGVSPGLELPPPGAGAAGPGVVMVVGVNGTGKTTTVAKLASRLQSEGRRPLLVQADTFRAAATEQTMVWAERLGLEVVHHRPGGDPAAVAFDGVRAARTRGRDVVLVDTAGRLHTRTGLVEELKKVHRVLAREVEGAPHETLLVVDGTAGLNALEQARVFHGAVRLTGVVVTKLDGTARGGVVLAIRKELGVPVKFVGVGEGRDDLVPFDPVVYARELVGTGDPG
ncbi:MAG: signal recognition particle-docking protein FtsY [Firmicutes bacterium]|nr:signal recognition particle-docking protein FtsY [Bacillota bacterium]